MISTTDAQAALALALEVEADDSGVRLDVLLVRRLEGLSRARARRMIEEGDVRLNGRAARKGVRVASGDRVELAREPAPGDFDALPAPELPLQVRFEDAELVIVDKVPGMPTHPLRPEERGTLANALVARYPEMGGVGYARREPGIVHRLDNDTSGLVLAARSLGAFDRLRAQLQAGRIDKRYLALVEGKLEMRAPIELPIAKHPSHLRRVFVCLDPADPRAAAARPARTEILRCERRGPNTLVELRATVALRHQVRAHMAAIGHPLVGDALYGGSVEGLGRHFLHASSLELEHPSGGVLVSVRSPLPADLEAAAG